MKCQQAKKQIHLYLDEQLIATDKLLEHISSCEECRKELAFWQKLTSAIQTGTIQKEPDDFTENLMKSLPYQTSKHRRYGYIVFVVRLLFFATTIFYSGWFFRDAIADVALSLAAFVENAIPSLISNFGQWFKRTANNTDRFSDNIANFRLWYFALWIIIVCVITAVAMQIIAIVEISMRQKR